jgi:hypothetical protein
VDWGHATGNATSKLKSAMRIKLSSPYLQHRAWQLPPAILGGIIVGQRQETDNDRRERFYYMIAPSGGVFGGK